MDISIIIPNYQSERYLAKCVASLRGHISDVSYEIIIVNNDSTRISSLLPSDDVVIIEAESNGGFAKACNMGARAARGKTLFFLNPDTEIVSGNIQDLIAVFSDPLVGIAAPRIMATDEKIQPWSTGYTINLLEVILNNLGIIRSKNLWKKNTPINQPDWTSGAALAISRDSFAKISGFDENFFMYFEDVDLCKRIKEQSLKILVLPSIQVLHLGGKSSADSNKQKQQYYASQDYYFKKHFGFFSLFFLKSSRGLVLFFKKIIVS